MLYISLPRIMCNQNRDRITGFVALERDSDLPEIMEASDQQSLQHLTGHS